MVTDEIGNWFKENREKYQWPLTASRYESEHKINTLAIEVKTALDSNNVKPTQDSLVSIHWWKNNNRFGISDKYETGLKLKGSQYTKQLFNRSSFSGTDNLEAVIRYLNIGYCNLPTCSAIASFLYGRENVPVIDRFIAQFFGIVKIRHMITQMNDVDAETLRLLGLDVDTGTREVLDSIDVIPFKLDAIGQLAANKFEDNLNYYLRLVVQTARIATELNMHGYFYTDIDGTELEFSPVDVEMAIFSWATKNRDLFN